MLRISASQHCFCNIHPFHARSCGGSPSMHLLQLGVGLLDDQGSLLGASLLPVMTCSSFSETLLFCVTQRDYVAGAGLPPKHNNDNFMARAVLVGILKDASRVFFSPEGELFSIRGGFLYRGHMPVSSGQDWFNTAKKVGQYDWGFYRIVTFDPQGSLYAIAQDGSLYKGPAPSNAYISWQYRQATKIGSGSWNSLLGLFFDPQGIMYAVRSDGKLVRRSPPTSVQDNWLGTATQVGNDNWSQYTRFLAFSPQGDLWGVNKDGRMYTWPGATVNPSYPHREAIAMGSGFSSCRFIAFTIDTTLRSIERFDFLPESAKIVSMSPDLLTSETYINESSQMLRYTFSVYKEVTQSSSFSQGHSFTVETSVTFSAGIPVINVNGSVSIDTSKTETWNFTQTNEKKETFSGKSDVTVLPHSAIRVKASVTKGEILVPYRATIRTIFGNVSTIEGMYQGTSFYDLNVSQEDYKKPALMSMRRLCIL
uniref:Tachylectin 2 domain-containing protein n=1 Tax=Leptobrachium leishanense TaxID=445787 RepID=A0A8C5PN51_9ANUR